MHPLQPKPAACGERSSDRKEPQVECKLCLNSPQGSPGPSRPAGPRSRPSPHLGRVLRSRWVLSQGHGSLPLSETTSPFALEGSERWNVYSGLRQSARGNEKNSRKLNFPVKLHCRL